MSRKLFRKQNLEKQTERPAVILGVDFSGAADAGKKIVIAECLLKWHRPSSWVLSLVRVRRACDLPGGGVRPEEATAALCKEIQDKVCKTQSLVVGIDSPPSIAKQFMRSRNWRSWAAGFSRTFPTPDDFREGTSIPTSEGASRLEPKRQTDILHKTPFPPQNLRMYKQTWWAINGVYAPLASKGFVVVPCMELSPNQPMIFEACPASLLKRLDLYSIPYKGSEPKHAKRRSAILRELKQGVPIGGSHPGMLSVELQSNVFAAKMISDSGGDFLDALLAAVGSACATRRTDFPAPDDGKMLGSYKMEACVYC